MGSVLGKSVKISIFGESHGPAIGVVIDGFPAGVYVDMSFIKKEMARRSPVGSEIGTARAERDIPQIISGVFEDRTTGAPITAIIANENVISSDYSKIATLIRPSHADYTGNVRYNGYNDYRGGGHFSGRLTAPLMFAGALCKLALENSEIKIVSHIARIGEVCDDMLDSINITYDDIEKLEGTNVPTFSTEAGIRMREIIEYTRARKDSIGGIVETAVFGVPAGLGSPMFDGIENALSSAIFGIPAVKGIEFGAGFEFASMFGSEANDEPYLSGGRIMTRTNNNGGILGGITNGMPVQFRVAFKPTPSISMPQSTVDMETMTEREIAIGGRHDPCIVPRALPVVEAVTALVLLDFILQKEGYATKNL